MNPQQMQMMAQMFQNPNGGGGMPMPQPGQGGVGAGAGMGMGPSFQGPDGAQGVQPMPYSGPMPDFTMGPYDPSQGSGIQPLGGPQPMPGGMPGWSPAASGGRPVGRPMPADPNNPGRAMPMPMRRQPPQDPMGNGAYPRNMGQGVQGAAGMRGSDGLPMDEEKRKALIQAILSRFGG